MDYSKRPQDPLFRDCVSTSLTEDELAYYLRRAWSELYGYNPTKEQLSILWCHTSLETGRGKFIYNNNYGNIKKREGQTYTSYKCNEILNGKPQWFEPYHPQTFFQSWDSATEGAKAYLQFLKKPRYAAALSALIEGNISKYCAKLKEGGYFTADLNYYTNLMLKLSKSFDKKSDYFMTFVPNKEIVKLNPEEIPKISTDPDLTPTYPSLLDLEENKKEQKPELITLKPEPITLKSEEQSIKLDEKIIKPIKEESKKYNIFEKILFFIIELLSKFIKK